MSVNKIGKPERETQDRIVQLFQKDLGYQYLGNWEDGLRSQPIEEVLLLEYLMDEKRGYSRTQATRAIHKLLQASGNLSEGLYTANKKVYEMLRYGVTIREEAGKPKETVWLIDWKDPDNNNFAVAEEVAVKGKYNKRPDVVLYLNGIAVGVLELKRSKVGLTEGIRQNLDNQSDEFIPNFFTTMQLVMAGNDSQGLRYGTIETVEKYYLNWKEDTDREYNYTLDKYLSLMCNKERLLELMHDFVVFDKGIKKLCRPNQYFGIKAAQQRIYDREGGVLWHTQGSGKSLTMVWLAKWIRQNITDSRVLIITDRDELDRQIEGLFVGVDEKIYRSKSGRELVDKLNIKEDWLLCSLVHKFGRKNDEGDFDGYIEELRSSLPKDFKAKGDIIVFVDECHRTQSGKLHEAMKMILPNALFIGFTGTPLLKKDKQKSIEVFGGYIGNPYKFDEAVKDGVVLDLLYEARDVDQFVTDQKSIDEWFDEETRGLTDVAKVDLKKKWVTMQSVLGSKSRLEKVVYDIIRDFRVKPPLRTGRGNAMLVSNSVYQACRYYELFQACGFKECAIITSYQPHHGDMKGETTGEGNPTESLKKYEVYQKMLRGKSTEDFETDVKAQFIKEPARMKLLIVVDKLLTGFDAPSATYLYIDKNMQDHGLFQAICRVNRVADEYKSYGYIVDYKDLFDSVKKSINDYTSGAFDQYDADDVKGLLSDRYEVSKDRLVTAMEKVRALCEPVFPKDDIHFIRYFCGNPEKSSDIKDTEEKRVNLYKTVASLVRAYTDIANELHKIGYSPKDAKELKEEVIFYKDLKETIKRASGDYVDLKRFEPGMRLLMDMYLDASSSKKISDFENRTLVDIIVNAMNEPEAGYGEKNEAVAETIENNVRRKIVEQFQTNPKYYERMSHLLDELIQQRRREALDYQEYLAKIKELASNISQSSNNSDYPENLDTKAKQALYDNLDQDEVLALALDSVIQSTKLDGWRDGGIKEKKLRIAVGRLIKDEERTKELMEIIKAQGEY